MAQPVPPFETGSTPVILEAKSIAAVATTPAVAFRKPVTLLRVKVLEATKFEVEAIPVTARLVLVAFVVVLLIAVKF